jgi:hypothetical protein
MKTGTLLIVGAVVALVLHRRASAARAASGAAAPVSLGGDVPILSAPVNPASASPAAIGYSRATIDEVGPDAGALIW